MTWVKGQSGNPKGAKRGPREHRRRYETMAWADLVEEWKLGGRDAIAHVRKNDPTSFFRICAGLLARLEPDSPVNHQHQIEVILKPPAWLTDDRQHDSDIATQAIDITNEIDKSEDDRSSISQELSTDNPQGKNGQDQD